METLGSADLLPRQLERLPQSFRIHGRREIAKPRRVPECIVEGFCDKNGWVAAAFTVIPSMTVPIHHAIQVVALLMRTGKLIVLPYVIDSCKNTLDQSYGP